MFTTSELLIILNALDTATQYGDYIVKDLRKSGWKDSAIKFETMLVNMPELADKVQEILNEQLAK